MKNLILDSLLFIVYFILFLVLSFLVNLLFKFWRLILPLRDLKIKKLGMKYCRTCNGSGFVPVDLDVDIPCGKCSGTGMRDWVQEVVDRG